MLRIKWRSNLLKLGDLVGLLVNDAGTLTVCVNGRRQAVYQRAVPELVPLYPFADLSKTVSAATLLPHAIPLKPGLMSSSFSADELSSSVVRFCSQRASKNVTLLEDDLVARHCSSTGDELWGVVFTNALPIYRDCCYFEVVVEETRDIQAEDGLVLGVTLLQPGLVDPPEVGDMIEYSWSAGYDGSAQVHGFNVMYPIDWNPSELRKGNRIALLVTLEDGLVWLLMDGVLKVRLPGRVPPDVPLYGFVDLLGGTQSVRLDHTAAPPSLHQLRPAMDNISEMTPYVREG
jgi:hypothetical protein